MAENETLTRDELFRWIGEQWQRTEDAIAALGPHFETHAGGEWSIGDIFRHVTASNHDIAARIRELLATGELPFRGDAWNEETVGNFRALDFKMLRIELNTAHGVVWMYIQRFSDEDLAQTHSERGEQTPLGRILQNRVWHEVAHTNEALEAAGLDESAIVPLETAHRWA